MSSELDAHKNVNSRITVILLLLYQPFFQPDRSDVKSVRSVHNST